MKKIFTFIFFCACIGLSAQNDFKQYWDSTFRNIQQAASLNSGYLWDLSGADPNISNFKGDLTDSISSFNQWCMLYRNFQNSALNPSLNPPPVKVIQKAFEEQFRQGYVAVPLLFAQGGRVKPSAYAEKNVYFDSIGQTWETKDASTSFEINNVFIASTFQSVFYQPDIQLIFSDEFYFGNSNSQILKIQVKMRGEIFVDVQKDTPHRFLMIPGENHMRFRFYLSNGKVYETRTVVYFETIDMNQNFQIKHGLSNPFNLGNQNGYIYAEPQHSTEFNSPLGAYIDYRPGFTNGVLNTCILKPIIIVEGIDFGYENFETGFYGGKCGSMGLLDLENGYLTNPHESKQKNRIEDWEAIKKGPQLLSELRNRGYDIFYLDFDNGADYMENNAMLLVKCIQLINEKKCSSEELVVLGASMGGVISRYALNYMEKNKLPHCVRTFVSFDAPHQGANIPLGLQHFLKYMRGVLPGVRETFDRKIDRAASRQLLVLHCLSEYSTNMHRDRKEFLFNLNETGTYPQLCRNIAVSNGSIDRSYQNFGPGESLLEMNPYSSMIDNNPLNFSAFVYAMSNITVYKKPVCLKVLLPLMQKHFETTELDWEIDNLPGSIRYDLRDARRIYGLINIINKHSASSFISTISSLDIKRSYKNKVIVDELDPKIPNPSIYPFQSYIGVINTNEEHMQLTDANIYWTIEEIEKNRNEMPNQLNSVYNFGRNERKTLASVTVSKSGKLHVNGNYNNGYGNGKYDVLNTVGSKFVMQTTDCSPLVVIEGKLELGDNNGNENNKAELHIRKGAVLMLKPGSVLKIHNGSSLVIDAGAQLVYLAGAKIALEGNDAILQIDGKLVLGSDAVFTFDKGDAKNSGFIKFRNAKGGFGNASIEIDGDNTAIDISGDGNVEDVVLQIEGELITFSKDVPYTLKYIKLKDCKVLYGNNSRITSNSNVDLDGVVCDKLYWANKASSDAFVLYGSTEVIIKNSSFKNLNFGVKLIGDNKTNFVNVKNSRFSELVNGIYNVNARIYVFNSIFDNCSENGVYSLNPETDVKIESCRFSKNEIGCQMVQKNIPVCYVFIENCDFNANSNGAVFKGCHSTVLCSRFLHNAKGLTDDLGTLNMSLSINEVGYLFQSVGGNNTFAYNSSSGLELNATLLFIENGKNNFIHKSDVSVRNFLTGNIAYSTLTHNTSGNYAYKAGGNYWSDLSSSDLSKAVYSHYFVKFSSTGTGLTLNYFTGNIESDINKTCYNPSSCNPCDYTLPSENKNNDSEMINNADFTVNPYPITDLLTIYFVETQNAKELRIRLINMEGKVLYQGFNRYDSLSINTSDYADGIYILEVSDGSTVSIRKILIQHN